MLIEQLRQPVPQPLSDGTTVSLRPIRPDDAARLRAFHARLSPNSIYLRWLSAHPVLTEEEAAQLSNLDYRTRMAYVATTGAGEAEQIVGVARYGLVKADDPEVAEAAVVVEDAYQGRGLGWALLARLVSYARAMGVRAWVAEINAVNARMLRFIERGGLPTTRQLEGGSWQVRMDISSVSPQTDDAEARPENG
jgi:GNAT superfamily N-acetyltransferase